MEASTWANLFTAATTVAAVVALLFARVGAKAAQGQLKQLSLDAERRDAQDAAVQARRVYWLDEPLVQESLEGDRVWGRQFVVVNNSDEPVIAVIAAGWDPIDEATWWFGPIGILWPREQQLAAEAVFTDVNPRPVRNFEPQVPRRDCQEATFWNIGVAFKDALGAWWLRYPDMTIGTFSGLPGTSRADDYAALRQELLDWHQRTTQRPARNNELG